MKTTAIFDLDGTLVSTIGLHDRAWQTIFDRHGISLSDSELKEQSGKKNVFFAQIIIDRRGRTDLDPQALSDEKDAMVTELLARDPARVFPGAKELLETLRRHGIKNILATSATQQTAVLLGKELMPYFDAAIFAEDVGRGKPDPEIFLTAAGKMNASPETCIVFEDAKSGVEAAKAGGFFCVAYDSGLGQDLSRADLVINTFDPSELLKYFLV